MAGWERLFQHDTWEQIVQTRKLVDERDDARSLPQVSAEFLHGLVLSGGFRRGVEVGTSYGYSGLWIGAAFQQNNGTLVTVEREPAKVQHARATFARAGLDDTVSVLAGDATTLLGELDGPFDFVFLDTNKDITLRCYELLWPKLAHRATIVTDNATSHAEELAEFLAAVREGAHLCSTLVPVGSGIELTIKLDPSLSSVSLDGADWVI